MPDTPDPQQPTDPQDPLGLGKLLGGDVMGQLQRLLTWSGGPVNWDLATDIAGSTITSSDGVALQPAAADQQSAAGAVAAAGRIADVWLDDVTVLPGSGGELALWSSKQWLDHTLPAWKAVVEPVAAQVTQAMGKAVEQSLAGEAMPPELAGMLGGLGGNPLQGLLSQVGGVVFGAQVGQALAALATDVLSTTEIGLPLGPGALLPGNIAAFSEGLEVPAEEVRLYLALREAAHQRLFGQVPWLRAHLFDTIEAYARGIDVDVQGLQDAVSSLDLTDPAAAQEALAGGLFELEPTAAQLAALERLETALALVEGWVDHVVGAAAAGRLPHAEALRETVRRRRASGGPAEQTFATLVGLKLRPKRLREASALWARITQLRGEAARDALWVHPDLLPTSADLDDLLGWGEESTDPAAPTTDWDAALRALDEDPDSR